MKTTREIAEQLLRIASSFKKSINYSQRSPSKENEKIIILGNSGVGKTAFVDKITKTNNFPASYVRSELVTVSSYDFQIQYFEGEASLAVKKEIIFYEIAGSTDKQVNFKNIFNNVKLFFIFVSATDTIVDQAKQVAEWQDFIIKNSNNNNYKIIVVKNKIDEEQVQQLNSADVEEINKKFAGYKAISVKNNTNVCELKEILDKELLALNPQINVDIEAWKKDITLFPDNHKLNSIDIALNRLNNDQANIILKSIDRLLNSGTTLNHSKAYNLSLFSGGAVHNVASKQKVPTYIGNMHQIINYISAPEPQNITQAKLKLVLNESSVAAKQDHFTRRQNTQVFYEKTIPIFLERVTTVENLKILKDINEIEPDHSKSLLNLLKEKLLLGTENNKAIPYKLGFLGGVVYEEGNLKVKVPHHVSLWLIKLRDLNDSSDCKLILQELFHDILAGGSSFNSSRNNVTQDFYQSVLPQWIKDNVTRDLPPGITVSPWVSVVCE